ncbi:MAG: hypothetical protein MUQ56_05785, partial [Thermoleophilia bacterium]|nr:hypothetical protein [Thermoleophilia bacterium]
MKASDIYSLVSSYHSAPEWACFPEVASGTGGGRRRIDALCCNLWKSRGFEVRGIEIKVSKADFQRELRAPDKADDVAKYCDTF